MCIFGANRSASQIKSALLADWDYIALKDRTIYLAFDSDIVTKEPVKKALERLAEHLQRRGARVFTIQLPQSGDKKVGIDDYLPEHPLEDAEKLVVELGGEERKTVERERIWLCSG